MSKTPRKKRPVKVFISYRHDSRERPAASPDLFLKEALAFFGDKATAESPPGAHEKAQRLACLVGERRALLILDGLEPLQYPATSPTPGRLKDLVRVTFPFATDSAKQSGQVTRLLRRLQIHHLIVQIPRSRRWRVSLNGRRVMATAVQLRKVAYPGFYAEAV